MMNRPMPNNPLAGVPMQMLNRLRQNPMEMLKEMGFDVAGNLTDPNEIIQHLMNSGQVSQQRYNQVRQMVSRFAR